MIIVKNTLKSGRIILIIAILMLSSGCGTDSMESAGKLIGDVADSLGHGNSTVPDVPDTETILMMIKDAMAHNQSTVSFHVQSEDLIQGEQWLDAYWGVRSMTWTSTGNESRGYKIDLEMTYADYYPIMEAFSQQDTSNLTEKQQTLYDAYMHILSACVEDDMSDYEKEKAVYEYIGAHCVYDDSENAEDTHEAYGTIVNGTSVCSGYAESFKTLMDMAGVTCMDIVGYGAENADEVDAGQAHEWNMVQLDGDWYHVDLTWDDATELEDDMLYQYFNVADDVMAEDHQWEKADYPEASATKYAYYLYESVDSVDSQDAFDDYLVDKMSEKTTDVAILVYGMHDLTEAVDSANMDCQYTYWTVDAGYGTFYRITFEY